MNMATTSKTLTSDKTRLITNRRCADMLGYGEVMANGDKTVIDGITVEAVPAYNITEGRTQFHPKGRDNGFILTIDGLRVYIAGDTEDIPEMSAITDIDVAFLPCNQPYTMTTSQLVNAAKTIKPKVVFPYHYGQTDVTTLPAQLKDEGIDFVYPDCDYSFYFPADTDPAIIAYYDELVAKVLEDPEAQKALTDLPVMPFYLTSEESAANEETMYNTIKEIADSLA